MNFIDFFNMISSNNSSVDIKNTIESADDENNDYERMYWLIVLFLVFSEIDYNTQILWEKFTEEVKTKNRFFPESDLLKKIDIIADKATCIINKGSILYRAREYSKADFLKNDVVESLNIIVKKEFPELGMNNASIFNESVMNLVLTNLCIYPEKYQRISGAIKKVLNSTNAFYGFDKRDSDAPPKELAKEGRANPKGISYLYAAMDIKTAIMEMRPQMQKMYNIATVALKNDVKVFDLTYDPKEIDKDGDSTVSELSRLSEEFSKPNFGDPLDYAPTQFLCEYIKRKGYDGIKYKSAVSETGKNVLLFDIAESSRSYDITGSKVYIVNSMDINMSQVIPIADSLDD